ncbi:hypothetical protein BDV12DRAFT_188076 [Aspergillus spectabilis]
MSYETSKLRFIKNKPRVLVTSDIDNEPDDSESFVRYLLYTNEFGTEGLVPVIDNLNAHTHPNNGCPDPQTLSNLVKSGPEVYGLEALNPNIPLAEGTQLLISALDASTEPLWVICWGRSNAIAQALAHVQKTRPPQAMEEFASKLRNYMISDQGDTGPWIRLHFPYIFLIFSVHGWCHVDKSLFSIDWVKRNTSLHCRLKAIRHHSCILSPMALGPPRTHHAVDTVLGQDGKTYRSNFATIWRWASAFQIDFAAWMQWSRTADFAAAVNYAPIITLRPDGDNLTFTWFHYKESTIATGVRDLFIPNIEITSVDEEINARKVEITIPPAEKCAVDYKTGQAQERAPQDWEPK